MIPLLVSVFLAAQSRFFDDRVAPILTKSCLACHNHELDDGDISFEERETLVKLRTNRGAAVVPGEPEKSTLVRAIRRDGDIQMPPGNKLAAEDVETLIEWIRRGAPWGTRLNPGQKY